VTFKGLKKRVSLEATTKQQSWLFERKPLYNYQKIIFDSLATQSGNANSSNKHLRIKKATGLGISEFMLRFMTWLCLKDNALVGSQMYIVTGPRIDLAIALIDRMKRMFAGSSKSLTSVIFDALD
jgi:hypothetical protein